MHVLNIYDPQNTWFKRWGPSGTGWKGFFKADGNEFDLQAKNCFEYYCKDASVTEIKIMGKGAYRKRQNLFKSLDSLGITYYKFDRINFFMHGHPRALNRGMIKQGVNLPAFAAKLKAIATPDCKIFLASCKTAKLDDGFAAEVAKHTGLEIIGHTTSGHTTKNPHKRYIRYDGSILVYQKYWSKRSGFGGIRALKKRLWSSKTAAFEFVEEVFRGV